MTLIMKKVWPREELKEIQHNLIAFAVTVAEILLDSEIPGIQITEPIAKPRIKAHLKNIVSFRSFTKMMLNMLIFFFLHRKKY